MPEEPDNPEEVNQAIDKLWSASDSERQEGKDALLRFGQRSVDPLLTLLADLMESQHPRFPRGKEADGHRALRRAQELSATREGLAGAMRLSEDFKPVSDLSINSRLFLDITELLGNLGAESAIPLLVGILEREPAGFSLTSAPHMRAEMIALYKIGPAAVPALIESVESADTREYAGKYPTTLDLSPIPEQSDLEESDAGDEASEEDLDFEFDEAEPEGYWSIESIRSVARAAMMLGVIGDIRALPVLKKALSQKECARVRHYIEQAMRSIERKN
jgi:hypothetical protein